jgi:hypothetical protein
LDNISNKTQNNTESRNNILESEYFQTPEKSKLKLENISEEKIDKR